jgi:hypothetical protein
MVEDTACNNLVTTRALTLPAIDPTIMPAHWKSRYAEPHNRSLRRRVSAAQAYYNGVIHAAGGQPAAQAGNRAAVQDIIQGITHAGNQAAVQGILHGIVHAGHQATNQRKCLTVVVPTAQRATVPTAPNAGSSKSTVPVARYVNTTVPFWPVQGDLAAPIPPDQNGEPWLGARTLQLLQDGSEISQEHEDRWRGVKKLGDGAGGRVGLWVKVNEQQSITERIAIKDSKQIERDRWDHAYYWRDQLPRDIAIQDRLRWQQGRPTVHEYRGYRLNMDDRRYRLYNECCDYGDLRSCLKYYRTEWSIYRRDHNQSGVKPPTHVIPESFIWAIFRDLVDACIFLRDGAEPRVVMLEGQDWRPIVHRDMHLKNLFVKPPTDGDGVVAGDLEDSTWDKFDTEDEANCHLKVFAEDQVSQCSALVNISIDCISTPKLF